MKELDWKDEAKFFAKIKDRYVDGLDFCRIAYDLFEYVKEHDQHGYELRKRPRNIKELIEEILPISVYIKTKYRLGNYIQVCWTSRTACFDAEIKVLEDTYFLEVTCAVHPKEYLVRELLDKQGYCYAVDGVDKSNKVIKSECISYNNSSFIEHFIGLIALRIHKKNSKNYPKNTILIICCELDIIYFSREWSILEEKVKALNIKHNFEEIFIYDNLTEKSFTVN